MHDRALFELVGRYARVTRVASVRGAAHLEAVHAYFRSEFMQRGVPEAQVRPRHTFRHYFGAEGYAVLDGDRVLSLVRIRTQGASFLNNLANRMTELVGWATNARAAFPAARLGWFVLLVRSGTPASLARSARAPRAYADGFVRSLASPPHGRPLVDVAALTSGVLEHERIVLDRVPATLELAPAFFDALVAR
jgi:hypothetical protein